MKKCYWSKIITFISFSVVSQYLIRKQILADFLKKEGKCVLWSFFESEGKLVSVVFDGENFRTGFPMVHTRRGIDEYS